MKCLYFAFLTLGLAQPACAETSETVFSKCDFTLNGISVFSSPCTYYYSDSNDPEQFATLDGKYFLYFILNGPNSADVWWNGEPFADHAHNALGAMIDDGLCWKNNTAELCRK